MESDFQFWFKTCSGSGIFYENSSLHQLAKTFRNVFNWGPKLDKTSKAMKGLFVRPHHNCGDIIYDQPSNESLDQKI